MRPALAALLVLGLAATAARADDPPAATPLFDGKTLEGWTKTDFYKAGAVRVDAEAGAIVLEKGGPMTGVTTTRKDLPKVDYELSYEARRRDGGDFFAAATFPVGGGFLTLVNGGWRGTITGLSSINGADASENETSTSFKYETDRWYRFRVRVTADRVRAWIGDGEKPTIDVVVAGYDLRTRIESRPSQPLGFASFDTTGQVRNIRVRPLTPAEVAAMKTTDEDEAGGR
jgi:hypothetical protein